MNRTGVEGRSRCPRTAFLAAAALVGTAVWVCGQDSDSKSSLQQKLGSRFVLTEVTKDKSGVVSAGTLLGLQKDNLLMYSTTCPSSPVNTYKNGKLSQSFGHNFMRDLGGSMRMAGGATTADCPQRRFVRGMKLLVTKVDVQKDGIVFRLYSTPDNDIPYYGDLKFPFEKGPLPTSDQALAAIAEVLTVQQAVDAANNAQVAQVPSNGAAVTTPGQGAQQTQPPPPPPPQQPPQPPPPPPPPVLKLPSIYVSAQTPADQLRLNADNTFSLQEAGQNYRGTFAANGNTLDLTIGDTGTKTTATMEANKLTDSSGQTWVLQEQSAQPPLNGPVLKNQDVISLAKAGLDDGIIIAKIASSTCQFDTSTAALIKLKQSGVSAAVIKAMVGAGK